jgi:hypothetical protein
MLNDRPEDHALTSAPNSAGTLLLLGPGEPRAPTAILSPAKRAALRACLEGGILVRQVGVWTSPSAGPGSGVTVADLGRDGMLARNILLGSASAKLTGRGSWFARTILTPPYKSPETEPTASPLPATPAYSGPVG